MTTLVTLLVAILSTTAPEQTATRISYCEGLLTGMCGVGGLIAGSLLLVRETRESFVVLREENRIITDKLKQRAAVG
jgi:hypothetical protein